MSYDMTVWRGNNIPIAWRFKNADGTLFNLTGSRFVLKIEHRKLVIRKDTATDADFVIDTSEATVTWNITVADTRLPPFGRVAKYELERWIDAEQKTLVSGRVISDGGVNYDA